MRIIIFTGKGGVGKTSVAASTAVKAASQGYKTLVMSTDPAHSLADSFDIDEFLGPEPREIAPNLFGLEVDIYDDLRDNWEVVRQHFATLMSSQCFNSPFKGLRQTEHTQCFTGGSTVHYQHIVFTTLKIFFNPDEAE